MRIVLGIICVVLGGWAWIGQIITVIDYPLAARLGSQEPAETIDPIFQRAEINTAKWDIFVLWTLLATGILMLANNSWWPYLALIAAGIYLDTSREVAKHKTMKAEGVRIGTAEFQKFSIAAFAVSGAIAIWLIVYAIWTLNRVPV